MTIQEIAERMGAATSDAEGGTEMRLKGYQAIEYAEAHGGFMLSKYTDPIEEAREDLTPEQARKVASEDPSLIYLDVIGWKGFLRSVENALRHGIPPEGTGEREGGQK